jgi:hypothetical protein
MKGRHWMIVWLGLFLGVAAIVVARQRSAFDTASELRSLRETHAALDARKAALERVIQAGSSAAVLLPKVRRLGLDLPRDTASTSITVETRGSRKP